MATRKSSSFRVWLFGAACLTLAGPAISRVLAQDVPPPPAPADPNAAPALPAAADPNVEVLTRGPVHEAYAAPVAAGQPTAGLIVPKQPPAAVDEIPPDMKPEGDSAVWIPGYWSWDDERKDFIWVSGVWRLPPPGFRWMPGYWQDNQGQGYQWISGYWMPAQLEEATFLPQPQASIDNGPTSEQPDANHFWVAGNWQWRETRYAWQPGYWAVCQPDWVWVPSSYYWCPSGWVYVPGYWDYPLARRGVVFSPVYFAGPVRVYRPAICLDVGVLSFSLFSRPAYCHYYFGDYYDDRYVAFGIRPWFYHGPHYGPDPLYGYYRWYHEDHLGEREWGHHLVGWNDYYRAHPDMRPPHTLEAQHALIASGAFKTRPDARQLYMAQDVHHVDAHAAGAVRLQQVSAEQHALLAQHAKETVHFQQERKQFERTAAVGGRGPSQPTHAALTNMSGYKSAALPGASAANVNAAVNRSAGGAAAGAAAGRAAIGAPGRSEHRDIGSRGGAAGDAAGAAVTDRSAAGVSPAGGMPSSKPAGGSTNPVGTPSVTTPGRGGSAGGGSASPGGTPNSAPAGRAGRTGGSSGSTAGATASGGSPSAASRGSETSGGQTGGRGGASSGGSRGTSASGRDDRNRDKDKPRN